ncbi:MAG: TRAP transporter small permease [Proteobacteria bacterium]|nr:TRAP transporter small permease [Pseudomonadota bacterium]MBU1712344.1 TRAP transporter small permease [Pseudomonadota bacterium]
MVNFIDRIIKGSALFAGICLFIMMLIGTFDVIGSKFFNHPIPGAFEFTEALMIGGTFMAIALTQSNKMHIAVDLLTSRLMTSTRMKFELVNYFLTLLFFFIVAWQGWVYGLHSFSIGEYESGLIRFPVYPAKLTLALGASVMTLQCLRDFLETLIKLFRGKP